jgi:hypothetical protein
MRLLFLSAVFLGAFLVFCVEPMIAKMVLPQFGGAPAVWNTCMVFFQAALLAGYALAHAATARLGARSQAALQVGLLALAIATLPFAVPAGLATGGDPALRLLGLLLATAGLPFLVAATTAPLLQSWFAATGHRRGGDPYFLYAASNTGSLLALVSYVAVIEPNLALGAQARLWAAGYWVLAGLVCACAVRRWRATAAPAEPAAAERIEAVERVRWVTLAFAPSSLLLGVTTYLTTDMTPVPLLWVVPLTLYLISFIIAFANPPAWILRACVVSLPPAIVAALAIMVWPAAVPHWIVFSVHLGTFFFAATACHIALAARRPTPARLTEFYLMLSLGGMLGGLFNAFIAPVIFKSVEEYPLSLALAAFLAPPTLVLARHPITWRRSAVMLDVALPLLLGAASYTALRAWGQNPPALLLIAARAATLLFVLRPLRFALALAITFGAIALNQDRYEHVAVRERNFFGVLRVLADFPPGMNTLMHGRTIHGMQRRSADASIRRLPLTYYFPTGPIGQVFTSFRGTPVDDRVGVIGLGVGSLAAYGMKGQEFTFFEIDPAVVRIARDPAYFHYLEDCRARWRIVPGDARLSLDREPDRTFGLIVLDAFSGDAIPVHLLTREALRIYLAKLADGGLIAMHISNNYLDILPVVRALALDAGLVGRQLDETGQAIPVKEFNLGRKHSQWVVLAREREDLAPIAGRPGWRALGARGSESLWTDDHSDLIRLLRWR